jgi:hypothetical protein
MTGPVSIYAFDHLKQSLNQVGSAAVLPSQNFDAVAQGFEQWLEKTGQS